MDVKLVGLLEDGGWQKWVFDTAGEDDPVVTRLGDHPQRRRRLVHQPHQLQGQTDSN